MSNETIPIEGTGELQHKWLTTQETQEDRGVPIRQEVWLRAWCYVASSSNVNNKETCAKWADKCLSDFDDRFTAKSVRINHE